MKFGPNGYLYMANGSDKTNQVLVYTGSGDSDGAYNFIGAYAGPTVSPAISHPFGVAFDTNNNGYISSQDTNVVTALGPPNTGVACDTNPQSPYVPGTPLAVASYLQGLNLGTFLTGTFVASSYGALAGVSPAPPNVPQPQGLDVDPPTGPASHSVRDMVVYNGLLYVCDEPGNAVKAYSLATGQLQSEVTSATLLNGPGHLLLNGDDLYITSSGSILVYDLTSNALSTFLSGLNSPAGMAFDSSSNFYFADRTGNAIYQSLYDSKKKSYGAPTIFIPPYDKKHAPDGLKDDPEFLVHV